MTSQSAVSSTSPTDPAVRTALVLGGTEFLGVHLVERLVAAGWQVDLFNRGVTNPDLFPGLTLHRGDRASDVAALQGGRWDVVYDLSGYQPDDVARSAQALRSSRLHYVFVSSLSVYADLSEPGADESSPLATLEGETPADVTPASYGPLKALCEQKALDEYEEVTIVRPGVIVGPLDPTDRFTYWVHRLGSGGRHLGPPDASAMLQYIDVRDLADWLVDVGERGVTGIFNATGPRLSFLELVQAVAAVTGAQASLVSLTEEQMRDAEVEAWTDIPLCFPPDDKSVAHFFDVDSRRARSAGLLLRPTADTVADTWSWCRDRIADLRCGLTPEREAQLLESVRP